MALCTVIGVGYAFYAGRQVSPLVMMAIAGIAAMAWAAAPSRSDHAVVASETDSGPGRLLTVADLHHTRDDLLAQWAAYQLDIEAWYITKPLLHDTTGTVATTVTYQRALQDFISAVDQLSTHPRQHRIDEAGQLADIAWAAWHEADDYATRVGLGDRTPTERAVLQRLGKLVERLTRSSAADPELPATKRAIQECLDKITTVSTSWADIAVLPAIQSAGLLQELPAKPL